MSEQAMWGLLAQKTRGLVGMERITEKLNPGVPDVVYQFPSTSELILGSYVRQPGPSGWVELKYVGGDKAQRALREGVVKIPWKNADQPYWLQRWARWGGRSGVLLQISEVGWYYWRPWQSIKWLDAIKGYVQLVPPPPQTPRLITSIPRGSAALASTSRACWSNCGASCTHALRLLSPLTSQGS